MANEQERRQFERHTSSAIIYIAPADVGGEVRWDEIKAVQCQDLSKGGVSFLMQTSPAWERLVVALGDKENGWVHIRSEVVYSTPVPSGGYLVGCKFLERTSMTRSPRVTLDATRD